MDNKITGNESAFPVMDSNYHEGGEPVLESRYPGLTIRQYYAGLAMQGLLANPSPEVLHSEISLSLMAVTNSDALIAELNKSTKP